MSRRVAAWLACFLLAAGAPLLGACGNAAPDEAVVEVVLFVDAAAQPGGDGSKDLPLPTIGAALALGEELAPDALTIEVAAGMYDEGALVIRGATAIRGSGKRPEIRGSFEVASAECSLQGLAVRDPGLAGVDVASKSAAVTLIDVEISGASGFGVRQHGGSLTLAGVTIEGTTVAGADRASGAAIAVAQGTRVLLSTVHLHHNVRGLHARGTGTHVEATGLVVEDSGFRPSVLLHMTAPGCEVGHSGLGAVEFGDLATGHGSGWTLRRSAVAGLYAHSGARVTVRTLTVSDSDALEAPDPEAACPALGGFGVVAHAGGQLEITDFSIVDSGLCGVVVGGAAGTGVDLHAGEVRRAPVGACLQAVGYDTMRLTDMVVCLEVGAPLQAVAYTLPDLPDEL